MNTGIQDGYNLAWKLALVLKGIADSSILETYSQERRENAKHLVQTTDRMFQVAAGSEWPTAFFRIQILPFIANYILRLNSVKNSLFPLISQIGIQYRHSSLSQHTGDRSFKVKAGDRMPYFLVDGQSIYDKLRQPKFHWLIFSYRQDDFQAVKAELENQNAEFVELEIVPLHSQVLEVFGTKQSFSVLLRPDNYIAFLSTEISWKRVKTYLKELTTQPISI